MTPGAQELTGEPARPVWVLTPLDNVGPLRFGMSADEAEEALQGARELSCFQADPFFPEILGIQYGLQSVAPAVFTYFDGAGRLFCVAADAACGPQVMLDGLELTGGVPAVLEQALPDLPSSPERGMLQYGPRGNPGVNGLGLVLRVQETATGVLTRPVLVGRDWADRCTDDWEGCIPKCEWTGRQWPPYPGRAAVWPSEGDEPNWHGWHPPF